MLQGKLNIVTLRMVDGLDNQTMKEYLNQVKSTEYEPKLLCLRYVMETVLVIQDVVHGFSNY